MQQKAPRTVRFRHKMRIFMISVITNFWSKRMSHSFRAVRKFDRSGHQPYRRIKFADELES